MQKVGYTSEKKVLTSYEWGETCVYVIGGDDYGCAKFDINSTKWTQLAQLLNLTNKPEFPDNFGCLSLRGYLYLF